ncbi:MAG: thioredoxin [Verrucomicrobiota bacterium]
MASNHIVTLTSQNFDAEVGQSTQPVLVDFWAEWCGPCKMLAPVLDELAGEFAGKARIAKLNIDEHQDLAVRFGISSIPTLLLFKGGQVVNQSVGLKPKAALKQVIEGALR